MHKTRSKTECPVFGAPVKFKQNILPTYADLMRNYSWIRQTLLDASTNKAEPTFSNICTILAAEVKILWSNASLPIVSDQQILHQIKKYHEKLRNLKKPLKSRKTDALIQKLKTFKEDAEKKLFDISACKCNNFLLCQCINKVPVREREFLTDQRSARKMVIGSVDFVVTQKIERSIYRKELESTNVSSTSSIMKKTDNNISSSEEEEDQNEAEDIIFVPEQKTERQRSTSIVPQMRTRLPNLAKACDRTGISDRAAAIITSSVLKDLGLITETDGEKVIDRNKVRRERKRSRNALKENQDLEGNKIYAIYFDGRKDRTLVQHKEENISSRKTVIEEHIVLVSEPGSKYFGHISVSPGTAKNISESIFNFLQQNMDLADLVAIGSDGTAVNTGVHNGIIRCLETKMGRPLQWFICLLHANELPLRHLMKHLDGETSGPTGYTGDIGRQLETCELQSVAKFKKIPTKLPQLDLDILSSDQKYLYEISLAISEGTVSERLARRQPGKMAHSRWLTTANRVLRLYIGTTNPSNKLIILTTFIQTVYVPSWFEIKTKPEGKYGSLHLFNIIQRSRYLPLPLKNLINKVIQTNGYFAHPENLLLCMLSDTRSHVRELSLRRILKSRTTNATRDIRKFKIPPINFEADNYINLINWQDITVTEPPMTEQFSSEELKQMIKKVPDEIHIFKFPCHSQSVERCVKLVTEASATVCGQEARDGFIRCRIASRESLPKFECKSDFLKNR